MHNAFATHAYERLKFPLYNASERKLLKTYSKSGNEEKLFSYFLLLDARFV